tara:strand:- start:5575 stop:6063 length:489 start_codon:yes stop_codon:yes gene_type:complete
MELFRFKEDRTADILKVKMKNNVYSVSETEAYKVDPSSVGFIWRSRLFGFGKPKRKPIVTVRENDGSTLHPLETNYINNKPMSYLELNSLENASFLQTQLEMEKKGSGMFDGYVKYLYLSIFGMVLGFLFIALPVAIPFVIDQYSNMIGEDNVIPSAQQTSN